MLYTLFGIIVLAVAITWLLRLTSKLPRFGKGKGHESQALPLEPEVQRDSSAFVLNDADDVEPKPGAHVPLPSRPPPKKSSAPMWLLVLFIVLNGVAYSTKDNWLPLVSSTNEEKLVRMCIDGLEENLERWARFDGWSVANARGWLDVLTPDVEANKQFNADLLWEFEVLIDNFSITNAFGASVRSAAICSGRVIGTEDNYSLPSSTALLSFTVNDSKLGF